MSSGKVSAEPIESGEERRGKSRDRRQRIDRRQGFNSRYQGPYRRMQLDRRGSVGDRRAKAQGQDETTEQTVREIPALSE